MLRAALLAHWTFQVGASFRTFGEAVAAARQLGMQGPVPQPYLKALAAGNWARHGLPSGAAPERQDIHDAALSVANLEELRERLLKLEDEEHDAHHAKVVAGDHVHFLQLDAAERQCQIDRGVEAAAAAVGWADHDKESEEEQPHDLLDMVVQLDLHMLDGAEQAVDLATHLVQGAGPPVARDRRLVVARGFRHVDGRRVHAYVRGARGRQRADEPPALDAWLFLFGMCCGGCWS